jgi:hypothetical protein
VSRRARIGAAAGVAAVVAAIAVWLLSGGGGERSKKAAGRDDLSRGTLIAVGQGNARARALAVLPDGGVAVAAASWDGHAWGTTIIRRGAGGERLPDVVAPALGEPYALAARPDGALIVLARRNGQFGVARVAPGGGLDSAFGDGQQSSLGDGGAGVLALATGGDIAVATDGGDVLAVTRVSADGAAPSVTEVRPDNANLAPGSQAAQPASPVGAVWTSDGGMLVGAASRVGDGATSVPEVVRFAAGGGLGGVTVARARGRWTSFAALPDGSTVVVGSIREHGRSVVAAVRFDPAGKIDTSFGDRGVATAPLGVGDAYAGAVAADPAGGLLIGANTSAAARPRIQLVRLRSDGTVDGAFGARMFPGRLGGLGFDRKGAILLTTSAWLSGRSRVGLYRLPGLSPRSGG